MKVNIIPPLCAILLSVAPIHAQQAEEAAIAVTDTVTVTFPVAVGSVNDFEKLFTPEQKAELEKIIWDFKKKSDKRIVVASIESIAPYEKFDQYALDLSNFWSITAAEEDNGLSLMISKNLRQIRISTSVETENMVSDEECKEVIDTVIVPEFKKGDFYEGVKLGVLKLIDLWK